ncbi:MAG TPA: phosphotransferase [Candidatus Agrococcus pullicola]|uniref:Phosphotransferase n=1 Tax=Candidatus Agrococcus pullicola TaxID=2838429 RepID=A0A9D1YUR1_9MICO|nr:phosphotransferase [Candidatus Agrococcus pullicola]
MTQEPTPDELARAFGLTEIEPESLTPWATVLPGRSPGDRKVVVKRTADSRERAEAMAAWTTAAERIGVPIVAPLSLARNNPQRVGDEWWVVYPFIDGDRYRGGERDARAAGDLLGRIHAASFSRDITAAMRQYDFPDTSLADVETDLSTLSRILPERLGDQAMPQVRDLGERWWNESLPVLRQADAEAPLPRAALSSDFRATNIVYSAQGVVLIDPDNGGYEPRLFDLAMAVVLFHREADTAPARMFNAEEWFAFYSGYARHITLTDRERQLWPHSLRHMLWEEGTWVLEDTDAAGWADAREHGYLSDLAFATAERYPLPL